MENIITRGTTPLCNLCVLDSDGRNIDFSSYDTVVLTVTDGTHSVDVNKANMTFNTDRTIDCYLTEAQTLSFSGFDVNVQIRAKKTVDGVDTVIASDILTVPLQQILKEGAL